MGTGAVSEGGAPGLVGEGGGVTGVAKQRRAEAPRGAAVLPERQREEEGEFDRWARRGSDSARARDRPSKWLGADRWICTGRLGLKGAIGLG